MGINKCIFIGSAAVAVAYILEIHPFQTVKDSVEKATTTIKRGIEEIKELQINSDPDGNKSYTVMYRYDGNKAIPYLVDASNTTLMYHINGNGVERVFVDMSNAKKINFDNQGVDRILREYVSNER
jgi:hypothetical protein